MKNLTAFSYEDLAESTQTNKMHPSVMNKNAQGTDLYVIKVIWCRKRIMGQYTCNTHIFTRDNDLMDIHVYCSQWFWWDLCFVDTKGHALLGKTFPEIIYLTLVASRGNTPFSVRNVSCRIQSKTCSSYTSHAIPADDLVNNNNISRYGMHFTLLNSC